MSFLPRSSRHIDSRRQFAQGLGVGALGLTAAIASGKRVSASTASGRAKRCLMLFLFGGPAQSDTFDLKPEAPVEYRGEFTPIDTSVPGIQWTEHLPRLARLAHHIALVRSVTMSEESIGDHHADTYYLLTGHRPDRSFFIEGINRKPREDDVPCLNSAVARAVGHPPHLPGVVQLPALSGEVTNYINPGQFSGRLGPREAPLLVRGSIAKPWDLAAPDFVLPTDLPGTRVNHRRNLLATLDRWQQEVERDENGHAVDRSTGLATWSVHERRAFELLTSHEVKQAFDVSREPEAIRLRYGSDINGQSLLLARRLLEAGVPSVAVHWVGQRVGAGLSWDTHSDNFGQLKNVLLPALDAGLSALLDDLHDRGLLDETVIFVAGEMGRTPKVGDPRTGGKGPPGRDHWIHLMPALLAGGGIRGGQVYGSSDRLAAYPAEHPVRPGDLAATVLRALGIPDDFTYQDREGRAYRLLDEGKPLPLFG
ncbi:MAG: DUF1501 domain-containing protein [Planctomycetaceae bacterium]|jgi:hypothetical protein